MKLFKLILKLGTIALAAIIILVLVCDYLVTSNAKGKLYDDVEAIPYREVGLLLGTTPQTRIGRVVNRFFVFRIDAAEKLYKAGKISTILISGDEDSLDGVNEVVSMKEALMARGIPEYAIILDGKGFRTLESIVRAKLVFDLQSFTLISQKFHNERALYQANHLDLDIKDPIAFNAESPHSAMALITYAREYLARVKLFLDIIRNGS
jgi:SanA protein